MKKIPTLFIREFENHNIKRVLSEVTPGMEWVLEGLGEATIKWDGSCSAIIDGEFYKRYDAKKGKKIPEGAIPCENEPDPITGHLPCWLKCDRNESGDKWFFAAYDATEQKSNGTYEAVGPHFQRNPYSYENDMLIKHGMNVIHVDRTYEGIREYLQDNYIEGIVFWKDGEPKCKMKRSDFGFDWNAVERDGK